VGRIDQIALAQKASMREGYAALYVRMPAMPWPIMTTAMPPTMLQRA
jgi:hypothetical protein